MPKSKKTSSILIPSMTVFFSSSCIMVLELVAGRLVARHLGSSLYTWTSVIGVVLAGISIGNYLGGRIADRFDAKKTLAVLFAICSAACVATVMLNNLVGNWMFLWFMRLPVRIFVHICVVFLVPSTMLGTISPVVAKMALDRGLPPGRTIGGIYAWGAAGSIAGTFLAGYYLIAAMGTVAIVWTVAGAFLVMAFLYWARFWALYVWATVFVLLITMGMAPSDWAKRSGANLGLRRQPDPGVIYEDETQYNYIAVSQISEIPDKRLFTQDALVHSKIAMDDITDLEYGYSEIYAAVTHRQSRGKEKLSVMVIGGGGYVYPRYIEHVWPGSRVDVVEIDAGVTEAAVRAFGLAPDTTINSINMDARNYVDRLLENERRGAEKVRYDFVYEDACNHYSVPFQLVTHEFNEKIARVLTHDGVYMINLMDIFDSGRLIGSFVNTLKQTFDHVYIVAQATTNYLRSTFVIIGSKRPIDLENLDESEQIRTLDLWVLSDTEMQDLCERTAGVFLTDNYAPVENMLAPLMNQGTTQSVIARCHRLADSLRARGRLAESIAVYKELLKAEPNVDFYRQIASMMIRQNPANIAEAAEVLQQGIEFGAEARIRYALAGLHLDLGVALKAMNKSAGAKQHFSRAIEGFQRELSKNPESLEAASGLGIALTETDRFEEGIQYLQNVVDMRPLDMEKRLTLVRVLADNKFYDEAGGQLRQGIHFMETAGRTKDAAQLRAVLEAIAREQSR